jgi:tetratricopeptide (TPR) repeat protein
LANDINHQEALSWASRSIFMSPNGTNMMTKAKLVAAIKGDKEKEEEVILASLQKDLESMNVTWKEWHAAANYATKVENWEKAISWVDKSIEMSRNMTNLMSRAKIYETKGEKDKAEKLRKEAIDKGTNAELNMYAYNLMWTGKTADAVKIFEANTEKNPTDPNVWDSLGEGYFNNGEKEKAIKAFKKSLSMNPPDAVAANSRRHLMQLGVKMDESKIKP